MVEAFDRALLGQPALPGGPRGPELGAGGGEPLRCLSQPGGADVSGPGGGGAVEHE
jgi:hypothetical protein